jgi:hypothetical protein
MTAQRIRLSSQCEGGLATGVVYDIALSCAREREELVLNGRLNVHGCCLML